MLAAAREVCPGIVIERTTERTDLPGPMYASVHRSGNGTEYVLRVPAGADDAVRRVCAFAVLDGASDNADQAR